MKTVTVEFGDTGIDSKVFDENGQYMESVTRVEVIAEDEELTVAKVTFAFPKVRNSATSVARQVGVLGHPWDREHGGSEQEAALTS